MSSRYRKTGVQSQVESYQRLKKWYLIPPFLNLSMVRYRSIVKWSNPGKELAPLPIHRCSSYWKGSLRVANFTYFCYPAQSAGAVCRMHRLHFCRGKPPRNKWPVVIFWPSPQPKNAIPRWYTGRKWHIPMASNRKRSRGRIKAYDMGQGEGPIVPLQWCTGGE